MPTIRSLNRHFSITKTPRRDPQPKMNEGEYYATEITDAEIDAQADSGEFFLDESGFYFMPTREDIRLMMIEGERIYIEELERDMLKELYDQRVTQLACATSLRLRLFWNWRESDMSPSEFEDCVRYPQVILLLWCLSVPEALKTGPISGEVRPRKHQ